MSEQGGKHLYEKLGSIEGESGDGGAAEKSDPGWYAYFGGIRFHDGDDWAGDPHPPTTPINYRALTGVIAAGVTIGAVVAWFLVWLGAQISPEHVYLPVKFVVKELPKAFR